VGVSIGTASVGCGVTKTVGIGVAIGVVLEWMVLWSLVELKTERI